MRHARSIVLARLRRIFHIVATARGGRSASAWLHVCDLVNGRARSVAVEEEEATAAQAGPRTHRRCAARAPSLAVRHGGGRRGRLRGCRHDRRPCLRCSSSPPEPACADAPRAVDAWWLPAGRCQRGCSIERRPGTSDKEGRSARARESAERAGAGCGASGGGRRYCGRPRASPAPRARPGVGGPDAEPVRALPATPPFPLGDARGSRCWLRCGCGGGGDESGVGALGQEGDPWVHKTDAWDGWRCAPTAGASTHYRCPSGPQPHHRAVPFAETPHARAAPVMPGARGRPRRRGGWALCVASNCCTSSPVPSLTAIGTRRA